MAERVEVICWICWRQVPLKECKTDDKGQQVHEECYAAGTRWKRTQASFLGKVPQKPVKLG